MSPLPKHLRPRWRYLAIRIEAWPDTTLDRRAFQAALWSAAQALLGDVGSAKTDLTLLHYSFDDGAGEAIIRTHRSTVAQARAAVACIDRVNEHPVGIVVRGLSGTVRACKERYMGERELTMDERTVDFGNAERTAVGRGDRIDIWTDGAYTGATKLDLDDH